MTHVREFLSDLRNRDAMAWLAFIFGFGTMAIFVVQAVMMWHENWERMWLK